MSHRRALKALAVFVAVPAVIPLYLYVMHHGDEWVGAAALVGLVVAWGWINAAILVEGK